MLENCHQHTCAWCGKTYQHTHQGGALIHFQADNDCPNPSCEQYLNKSVQDLDRDSRQTLLLEGDSSFLFNRDSLLYDVNIYKNMFHSIVECVSSGEILQYKAIRNWLRLRVSEMCHNITDKSVRTHGRTLYCLITTLYSKLNKRKVFTNLEQEWYHEKLVVIRDFSLKEKFEKKSKQKSISRNKLVVQNPLSEKNESIEWDLISDD